MNKLMLVVGAFQVMFPPDKTLPLVPALML
jgi:hypothetical protein